MTIPPITKEEDTRVHLHEDLLEIIELEKENAALKSALSAAEARIAELEERLTPFARCAEKFDRADYVPDELEPPDDDEFLDTQASSDLDVTCELTFGDFRRARAALSSVRPAQSDTGG